MRAYYNEIDRNAVACFPGRVGQLRAYGNAIVPQVAAAFIQAVMGEIDGD